MDFSEWSCCKEIRTSERASETLEASQYRQFRRPAVTRGLQPAWKKNNFQNGTRNWAFMELEIEDLRHAFLTATSISCRVVCLIRQTSVSDQTND
jgi:hypothetical protein